MGICGTFDLSGNFVSSTATTARAVYPFTAIVGQDEMKLALLLNVIDPRIGGVMIMGDRGTGKSTTIRALADLLPEIDVVADDPFNSDSSDPELMSDEVKAAFTEGKTLTTAKKQVPMVDLPLGATEDRVCGTLILKKRSQRALRLLNPAFGQGQSPVFSTLMKSIFSTIT